VLPSKSPVSALRRFLRFATVAALALAATGCQTWRTYMPDIQQFGVYKLDINQGNFVTQDMVDKLKPGLSRPQVRLVLGTPLLVSAFHDNRWDYVYQYTRNGRRVEHRQFTVFFVNDQLARWEGDELPVSAAQLNRIAADRALAPEPSADDQGFLGRILDILKGNW
jgi:outer membrane protein assembly factor BamE